MYLIFLSILVFGWTLNPFLKKIVMRTLNPYEYYVAQTASIVVVAASYFIAMKALYGNHKLSMASYRALTHYQLSVLALGAFLSVLSTFMYLYLINTTDISKLVPHIQSVVIVFTALIGYFIFKEDLGKKDILGIALIISGITLIKYKFQK